MSTWNYRVIEFTRNGESWRAIHEVHYKGGLPVAYSKNPAVVQWDSVDDADEAHRILERMRLALSKTHLKPSDFPGDVNSP